MSDPTFHFSLRLPQLRRKRHGAAMVLLGIVACISQAARADTPAHHPSSLFSQFGSAHGTRTLTAGLTWDLPYRWQLGPGELSSYLETSYAYWRIQAADRAGLSHLSQLALVPVLRYRPDEGSSPWFFETGVGLTATSSRYRTRQKSFSTSFNFSTHLAVGRSFGAQREHEIALRLEHFSNAGIKHPNPGENFLQLRYARRF
ncbi:acyloxyacyl hydrolase [Variovorax sp. EBFNA2]|uniref:acyloxyacyl hydrolase n=1 Tax=Variovorax sp. EBFNA2 TaxID=3342097 RepID=UPI0029C0AE5B|nr:acyloxyacyl hydrolase [Variovorax boronicumulans]WPG35393.1 acyloxyacyl hydrolase [Variovorax boronicumulans]